jgi:putative oxidoreductase
VIDAALLTLRSVTGGLLAGHGAQKLFGAFQGPGLEGTRGMMRHLRLEPSEMWGTAAAASEFAGGTMTTLGLGGSLGPIVGMAPMVMATTTAHWGKPIWVTSGGAELPVTNLGVFTALAIAGPGSISLDRALGLHVPRWMTALAVCGVAGGCVAALAMRRPAPPEQPPQVEETQAEEERELTAAPERMQRRAPAAEEAQA